MLKEAVAGLATRRTIAQLAASDGKFVAGLRKMFNATFGDRLPTAARFEVCGTHAADALHLRCSPEYFAGFAAECAKGFVKK